MARVSNEELHQLASELGERLRARGWMLATAESCTGGWVGQLLTSLPGSSHWYERGFITYSNIAKIEMLGVPAETLATHGAVSEETASAMAAGALAALVGLFSAGLFEYNFGDSEVVVLFLYLTTVPFALKRLEEESS